MYKSHINNTLFEYKTYNGTNNISFADINVNYLHLKVNENNIYNSLLLQRLFEDLTLDNEFIYARLHKNSNTVFKIFKPAFMDPSHDMKMYEKWFLISNNTYINNPKNDEHIVLKIKFKNVYFTLIIHQDLSYDVKFIFKRNDNMKVKNIVDYFDVINKKLKEIRILLDVSDINLPDITNAYMSSSEYFSNTIIKEFIYFSNIENTNIESSRMNDLKLFISSLPNVISLLTSDKTLHMIYKRIDEFNSSDKIQYFIQLLKYKNENINTSEIVSLVSSYFNIELKDAKTRVAQATTILDKSSYQRYVSRKHISIKLKFSDTKGCFVYIDGLNSSRNDSIMFNDIMKLITYILSKQYKNTNKNIKPEKIKNFDFMDNTNEPFEIDEEFQHMIENILDNDNEADENIEDDIALEKGKSTQHAYLLTKLYQSDRKLFYTKNKIYSKMCQLSSGRQPIAVNDSDYQYISDNYKDAYDGSVRYGSSSNNQYNYICPRIWCPLTKIPLTEKEYKEHGYKCPTIERNGVVINFNEKPIVQQSESYWGTGNKVARYPGFLSPTKHPDGLCMPCCFRKKENQWKKCLVSQVEETEKKVKLNKNNEKYIIDFEYNPTDINRFSLLPESLHMFLGNTNNCGHRNNGSGLITSTTKKCLAKKGIAKTNHSFFECVSNILENPKLKNANDVIKSIQSNLTITDYLSFNNGGLVRIYIPTNVWQSPKLNEFKKWSKSNKDYFNKFNIQDVRKKIKNISVIDKSVDVDVLREYIIFSSYTNFKNTLEKNRNSKHLIELINAKKDWLNVNGYNIIILYHDQNTEKIKIKMSSYEYDVKNKFIFVLEFGNIFEPIHEINSITVSKFSSKHLFNYNDNSNLKSIIDFVIDSVDTKENKFDLYKCLKKLKVDISNVVINPDFQVIGFLTTENIYVPFTSQTEWCSISKYKDYDFYHVYDVYKSSKYMASKEEYIKLFKLIKSTCKKDDYKIKQTEDKLIVLPCGIVLPTKKLKNINNYLEKYIDDKNILIGYSIKDARLEYMNVLESSTSMYTSFLNEIITLIKQDANIRKDMYYIKHPHNPYSRKKKVAMLTEILSKLKENFVEVEQNELELSNTTCSKMIDKQMCQSVSKCVYSNNKCKFRIPIDTFDNYLNQAVNELIQYNSITESKIVNTMNQTEDVIIFSISVYVPFH